MKKILFIVQMVTLSLYAQMLSLQEAINIALKNNQVLQISKMSLLVAEAQYQQALSANYPQITASMSATRTDEDPSFQMRGEVALPNEFKNLLGALVADGGAATGAFLAANPSALSSLGSLPMNMDVKLMGRDTAIGRLELIYPLYTGGKIDAIIKQASLNKTIQSEVDRRNEAEVVYDVKRYYYGVMLTQKLSDEVNNLYERMKMVRDLTESLYQGGSLAVKKTDFLRVSTSLYMVEAMKEEMKSNIELSKSALINAMGLSWNSKISLAQEDFNAPILNQELQSLVEQSYRYNPNYTQLKLAIDVYDAKIDEAKSGYLPTVALTGNVQHIENSYKAGLVNDTNRNSWTIGIGVQWKLFEGFRTDHAVEEARLNRLTFTHKEVLLKEGLALQVKHAFMKMGQNARQDDAFFKAKESATQNASLNIRAYEQNMVETKDVVEAQIMEIITKVAYLKNLHDFATSQSQLDFIVTNAAKNITTP